MLSKPMDILERFPIRKSGKQKAEFREEIKQYGENLGYNVLIEKGSLSSQNVVMGNPDSAKYLVTAHYDTCARLPFPNLITPCSFVGFMGYQLFTVLIMFLLIGVISAVVGFTIKDAEIAKTAGYISLWALLILMMAGPANRNNANDNTSGVVTLLEIADKIPEQLRDRVCFVLFDLEEVGLIGSAAYKSKHKKSVKNQIVLNLDCVGDGDYIGIFPTKKLKKDAEKLDIFKNVSGTYNNKMVFIRDKGFSIYPSDQANFPYGVGICALNKSKFGLYLSRIHTPKDTILEHENVNILCEILIKLIAEDSAQ